MAKENSTDIVIVLDRSGSMESIKEDMEGAFATFISEQQKIPGECHVSLYQFAYEMEVIYERRPLFAVPHLNLEPLGGTALYDALGSAIERTGRRLAALPVNERPSRVLVVLLTDGQENSSRQKTLWQIQEMIKHQTEKYSWGFIYLGSALTTKKDAQAIGIHAVANFTANAGGVRGMATAVSNAAGAYRSSEGTMDSHMLAANLPSEIPEQGAGVYVPIVKHTP